MTMALLVSNLLLWALVISLAIIVFALTRQIGVLHERVAPAGALTPTSGPKVGELTKAIAVKDLSGRSHSLGGAADAATLLLFVSPTCPVCRNLVPTAQSLARHERKAN